MITNANNQPEIILPLGNGNYHVNFGIEQVTITNPLGDSTTGYKYNSVEISGSPDYGKIISAIVADKYPFASEIALINNFNQDKDLAEYDEYQRWRRVAKYVAASATLTTVQELDAVV
ncbi:MAG: hypothetical protein WCI49_10105 [Ferruginibacter sp.]